MSCQGCACTSNEATASRSRVSNTTLCDAPLDERKTPCCQNEDSKAANDTNARFASIVNADVMRDIIIGLSDGLTVPFALTAGLASTGSSRVVVLAGVAELVSGAISMGAGGYLSAKTEYDHAVKMRKTTSETLSSRCSREKESEIAAIMDRFGVSTEVSAQLSKDLAQDQEKMLKFILQLGHELDEIAGSRVYVSAITIGTSYLLGGLIPLLPYIFCHHLTTALFISIAVTGFTLFVFGAVKQQLVDLDKHDTRRGWSWSSSLYGAVSTLAVGGAAAGASYGIVRGIESRMGGGGV